MLYMIEDIFFRVKKLSGKINKLYDINPTIKLKIFSSKMELNGSCVVDYKNSNMYIELNIPHDLKMTLKNRASLDILIIHEYCHFIEALSLTWPKRTTAAKLYLKNLQEKTRDVQKTWRQTKELAQILGMWNKDFYNSVQDWTYVSNLNYN